MWSRRRLLFLVGRLQPIPHTKTDATSQRTLSYTHARRSLIAQNHRVVAGVVLTRPPQITRDPTPFEKAYADYQEKLNRATAQTFPAEFYFKKGSIAEKRWQEDEQAREAAMNSATSLSAAVLETDVQITEGEGATQQAPLQAASRITEADQKKDVKSLDRQLAKTLYLIVKKPRSEHSWQFPQGGVEDGEALHEAAFRELAEECGTNMDVWFVGRTPIGHYKYQFPAEHSKQLGGIKGAKVFFMKAHIYAGQAKPDDKEITDFAWVTKQELKDYVSPEYYEAVKDMLSDQ